MNNKARLFAFLLTLIVFPVITAGQNNIQETIYVDSVIRTMSVCPIDQAMFQVPSDDLRVGDNASLKTIQDTLNQIADRTTPKKFLGRDAELVNSKIGLWALIAGILAAIFGFGGFVFQVKSARSLKKMEVKRLPFGVFAQKLYETQMVLDILMEIEDSDCSEEMKKKRRKGYGVDKLIEEMKLPDDLVDLTCYRDQFHYEKAYSIIFKWRSFNSLVNEAKNNYRNSNYTALREMYEVLRNDVVEVYQSLVMFEDVINLDSMSKKGKSKDFVRSNKKFTIKKLTDYGFVLNCSDDIKALVNPCMYSYKDRFDTFLTLPNVDDLKMEDKPNLCEKIMCNWKKLYANDDKNITLSEIREKKQKKSYDKLVYRMVYDWSRELRNWMLIEGDRSWTDIYKENPLDALCLIAIRNYLNGKSRDGGWTVSFLNEILYSYSIAEKRLHIIDNNDLFLEAERGYFERKKKTYLEFAPIFTARDTVTRTKITFYDLLNAIVCEQNINVSVDYMLTLDWNYKCGRVYESNDYCCGYAISPLLDKLGIAKDGEVIVKTKEGFEKTIMTLPQEILEYEIYPVFDVKKFADCVLRNIGISPFVEQLSV